MVLPQDDPSQRLLTEANAAALYVSEGDITITPETYGAVGNGVADDTAAVQAAFTEANSRARTGLNATIQHPGTTVLLTGVYNMATLTAPIQIKCNVAPNRATLLIPLAYAGIAVQVGHPDSGGYFTNAEISLPDVVKPVNNNPLVAGSVGVRVQNLGSSILNFGRTYYFETAQHYTGWNQGTVYNVVNIGHIAYCKRGVVIKPDKVGAWANQNTFVGGGIQQSTGFAGGPRQPGWRHVIIDGNGINACDMNRFIGTSFEGDVSEYHIEIRQAIYNKFEGNRFEQGALGVAVTVAGDTITRAAHGLAVGSMVTFSAGTVPGGMVLSAPYFVVSAPTVDTFTVSHKKDGAAVTFTTAGASVTYFRPPRVFVDSSLASVNVVEEYFAVQGVLEIVDTVAAGSGNVVNPPGVQIADNYSETDFPAFRGRNRKASSVTRPIYAAYPPAVKPTDNPNGWTTALSDRGLLFAAAETETGRIGSSGGALNWKRPQDAVSYEIPSARRSPGLVAISGLVCAANTTTATTFTLTGASVNDHVLITMLGHTAGMAVSHGYVSAADTVTVVFQNLTAAAITLTTSLQAVIFRRYY